MEDDEILYDENGMPVYVVIHGDTDPNGEPVIVPYEEE